MFWLYADLVGFIQCVDDWDARALRRFVDEFPVFTVRTKN